MRSPVLIVGKGDNVVVPSPMPKEYTVACLNGAIKLCNLADWLFVNDLERFEELPQKYLMRARALVVPTELHKNWGATTVPAAANLPYPCPPVFFYRLPSARTDTKAVSFGPITSVADTAVAWLLDRGHRSFIFTGITRKKQYASHFPPKKGDAKLDDGFFERNWQSITGRIERAKGSWRMLNEGEG